VPGNGFDKRSLDKAQYLTVIENTLQAMAW